MWIKYLTAVGSIAKDESVEVPDEAKAKGLIAAGIAEETKSPAEVAAAATSDNSLRPFIEKTIKESVAEMTKGLRGNGGVINIRDRAELPSATAKRYGLLKSFANNSEGREKAYRFGQFMLAVYGKSKSRQFCKDQGIELVMSKDLDAAEQKTSTDSNNTSAGFLVANEFSNDLIDLREKYGVFRQNAKIVPMASDVRSDPRRKGGLGAYFVGENNAVTFTDKTWDRVGLTAKKLMVLTAYSSELNEDAVINIGDDLAGEIAYAFALKEDQCGFIGDGTSTYGGIVGVTNRFLNLATQTNQSSGGSIYTNVIGITVMAATGGWTSAALSDFNRVVGDLPEYADTPNAKWYCSKPFWGGVMQKLATAGGGNRVAEIEDGALKKSFLGYDVVVSQVMPKTTAINQICAIFGDLRLAASLGDRRITTIQMSDQYLFNDDAIALRGTERFDINVHDIGETTLLSNGQPNPGRDPYQGPQAGPIVVLMTAAS